MGLEGSCHHGANRTGKVKDRLIGEALCFRFLVGPCDGSWMYRTVFVVRNAKRR